MKRLPDFGNGHKAAVDDAKSDIFGYINGGLRKVDMEIVARFFGWVAQIITIQMPVRDKVAICISDGFVNRAEGSASWLWAAGI
jgi:hypothetical protein